jgi:hypothetical protein
MYVLYGKHPVEGDLEQNFTLNERDTALHVARCYAQRRWNPRLVELNYRGEETPVQFEEVQRKAA